MVKHSPRDIHKVLIASANLLFRKGLEKMVAEGYSPSVSIQTATSTGEALEKMEAWQPDLVIVDYDDSSISRTDFLRHFIEGNSTIQLLLVSLQASGDVVVYDRRTLTPAEAQDWLHLPTENPLSTQPSEPPHEKRRSEERRVGKE